MTVGKAVRSILVGNADVTAIAGDRIRPNRRDRKGTLPACTYRTITGRNTRSMQGATGLVRKRVQIDCLASTYAEADGLAEAVRLALDDFTGTAAGTKIQSSEREDQGDTYLPPVDGDEQGVHQVSLDFGIWYEEPTS